jgi:hypothetical protein
MSGSIPRIVGLLLLAGPGVLATCARADPPPEPVQHAEQDLKDAGHAAADTAKEGALKVKQAVDEGKQAVKDAVHKGAEKVEEGAKKVEDKTKGE